MPYSLQEFVGDLDRITRMADLHDLVHIDVGHDLPARSHAGIGRHRPTMVSIVRASTASSSSVPSGRSSRETDTLVRRVPSPYIFHSALPRAAPEAPG